MALTDIVFNPGEGAIYIIPPGQAFTPLYSDGTVYTRPQGTVVTDAGNSATAFKTNLTEGATDYWKDALLLFTTGNLKHQTRKVSAFNFTTDIITVSSAYTGTPAAGDKFVLINF